MSIDPFHMDDDDDGEPVTMSQRIRIESVNAQLQLTELNHNFEKSITWKMIVAVVGVIGVTVTVLLSAMARAESTAHAAARQEVDAGLVPIKTEMAELKVEVKDLRHQSERQQKQLDLVLDALRVPISKRPEPVQPSARDAGK